MWKGITGRLTRGTFLPITNLKKRKSIANSGTLDGGMNVTGTSTVVPGIERRCVLWEESKVQAIIHFRRQSALVSPPLFLSKNENGFSSSSTTTSVMRKIQKNEKSGKLKLFVHCVQSFWKFCNGERLDWVCLYCTLQSRVGVSHKRVCFDQLASTKSLWALLPASGT